MSIALEPQPSLFSALVHSARRLVASLAWRDDAARDQGVCHTWRVLLISGLCGIVLGVQTGLQIPVESAQVLAGAVQYPADNPFYIYHVKSWTLLHQVSALLLASGLSDRAVSMLLGGLAGMVSLQALALCTLAIGRQWLVAVLVPILCLGTKLFDELGGAYDIYLLSDRTWKYYGALATALVLLVWALYGVGLRRTSACLMGLAPACHPTLGCWCLGIGVLSIVWNWRQERPFFRGVLKCLLLGLAVSAGSFAYHLHQIRDLPSIAPELRDQFVTSFAVHWDRHRQAVPLDALVLNYGLGALVASTLWLLFQSGRAAAPATFLVQSLMISAVLGLLLVLSTHLGDRLPTLVMMAIPGRYINVVGLAFPALVLGMLSRHRLHPAFHVLSAVVIAYLVLWQFRSDVPVYVPELRHAFWMATGAICIGPTLLVASEGKLNQAARCLRWSATAFLIISAASTIARDRYVAAAYLLPVVLIHLPGALRRLLDHDMVRWLVPAVTAVCGVCAAVEVLGWQLTTGIGMGLLAVWAAGWRRVSCDQSRGRVSPRRALASRRAAATCRGVTAGALACASMALVAVAAGLGIQTGFDTGFDYRNDPLLNRVYHGSGLLLSGPGVRSLQLRTRRPVLLEVSALNQLPYVPESGPLMNHILRRIYDEDVFKPRPAWWVIERGGLMRTSAQDLWQARTVAEWRALAKEFGFTQIVVRDDWHLQLPVVSRSNQRALYEVPGEDSAGSSLTSSEVEPAQAPRLRGHELPVIPSGHRRTQGKEELDP